MLCRICQRVKPESEMVINHTTPIKKHYKDICKTCSSAKNRVVNQLRKENNYPDDNYQCPICSRKASKYYLDHDWTTHEFRGWLCNACNVALGLFKDDPKILNNAINYLGP